MFVDWVAGDSMANPEDGRKALWISSCFSKNYLGMPSVLSFLVPAIPTRTIENLIMPIRLHFPVKQPYTPNPTCPISILPTVVGLIPFSSLFQLVHAFPILVLLCSQSICLKECVYW